MNTLTPQRTSYRFLFPPAIDLADVQETLALAVMGVEAIHGSSQVQLDARYDIDDVRRSILIDTDSGVGSDLARLFVGYAGRQYPGLRVERITRDPEPITGEGAGT